MVKYQNGTLDRTFAALADPTRRALLAQLSERSSLSISDLARPFPVTLPAIMKHLDVLSEAGLIMRSKSGRTVSCQLNAAPMENAVNWLNHYQRFWSAQLDRLAVFVEDNPCSAQSPVSSSSAASKRHRQKSTPPGRTRKN